MPRDFYPRREADIVCWTANFRAKIAIDFASLGLSQAQADAYAQAQGHFESLFAQSQVPSVRTVSISTAKNAARIALEAITRQLAAIVRAQPGVTTMQRSNLGLAMRNPGGGGVKRTPPATPPLMIVRSQRGRTLELRFCELATGRMCKPRGATGVMVMLYAGDQPPIDLARWTLAGMTSRCDATLTLPSSIAGGARVWLSAMWHGRGRHRSRAGEAMSVTVPHGAIGGMQTAKATSRGGCLMLAA